MKFRTTSFLLLLSYHAQAQTFLNGSFEITSATGCSYNLSNTTFNNEMSNTFAYGSGDQLDIMSNCLPYCSSAESGTYYVGIAIGNGDDAFTMKLTTGLIPGTTYTMSFGIMGIHHICFSQRPYKLEYQLLKTLPETLYIRGRRLHTEFGSSVPLLLWPLTMVILLV